MHLPWQIDGQSLAPLIQDNDASGLSNDAYEEWVGDRDIPEWWEIRTPDYALIEYVTGERELYDLRSDPLELTNVIGDPTYASTVSKLEGALELDRGT